MLLSFGKITRIFVSSISIPFSAGVQRPPAGKILLSKPFYNLIYNCIEGNVDGAHTYEPDDELDKQYLQVHAYHLAIGITTASMSAVLKDIGVFPETINTSTASGINSRHDKMYFALNRAVNANGCTGTRGW